MTSVWELGTGWLPEVRDRRDHTVQRKNVASTLERMGVTALLDKPKLPASVDLRRSCPPVFFQGGYNDCAANVVAALVEYFGKRARGRTDSVSRLFLWKVARNLAGVKGNSPVYIRQVIGALKLIGAPPAKFFPYLRGGTLAAPTATDTRIDAEPSAFCYALAGDYRSISYYRLDFPGQTHSRLLEVARAHLAAQVPFAMGFPLSESIHQSMKTGRIPYPSRGEKRLGNHAVLAVGYDDRIQICNRRPGSRPTIGALRIQNSWSARWGDKGFGWLPYRFVLQGHVRDLWTLTKIEWIDTLPFQANAGP
jgi:C1A family cysteine protease